MRLSIALQDKLMDVRLREKLIFEGKVKREEVEEYLKNLPDESERVVYTDKNDSRASEEN